MATRAQSLRLGGFVIAAVALATTMLITFTAAAPFEDRVRYYVQVPDANGLEVGSQVHVRGVRVGSVTALDLYEPDRRSVRVTLEIDEDVPINADAQAFLEMKGVTGLKQVNIRDGTGIKGTLEPGSFIPHGSSLFDTLTDRTEMLLASAGSVLESTDRLVDQMNEALGQVDASRVDSILANTDRLMAELVVTGAELSKLVHGTRAPLARSLESSEATFRQMERLAREAEGVLGNMNLAVSRLSGMVRNNDDDLRATLRNLRRASESFETLGRELRNHPSLLLFSDPPEERELP